MAVEGARNRMIMKMIMPMKCRDREQEDLLDLLHEADIVSMMTTMRTVTIDTVSWYHGRQ